MDTILLLILLIANIPVYKWIFKSAFKNSGDFKDAVNYTLISDIFSLSKGRFWNHQVGEAKLSFFIFICIMVVVVEFAIIKSIINAFI